MTNAELLAKIKARIERLKATNPSEYNYQNAEGYVWALDDILSFLSNLESETTYDTQQYTPRPSVDIDDVARVQFASHAKVFDRKRKAIFDWEQFKEVAGIFYGFGKKDHLDTLESEKPMQEGLEEEYKDYVESDPVYSKLVNRNAGLSIARHFAEWGADHTHLPEDTVLFNKGVEEGKRLMMEEAVDAIVEDWNPDPKPEITIPLNPEEFTCGDKVRVIICKKED